MLNEINIEIPETGKLSNISFSIEHDCKNDKWTFVPYYTWTFKHTKEIHNGKSKKDIHT